MSFHIIEYEKLYVDRLLHTYGIFQWKNGVYTYICDYPVSGFQIGYSPEERARRTIDKLNQKPGYFSHGGVWTFQEAMETLARYNVPQLKHKYDVCVLSDRGNGVYHFTSDYCYFDFVLFDPYLVDWARKTATAWAQRQKRDHTFTEVSFEDYKFSDEYRNNMLDEMQSRKEVLREIRKRSK